MSDDVVWLHVNSLHAYTNFIITEIMLDLHFLNIWNPFSNKNEKHNRIFL